MATLAQEPLATVEPGETLAAQPAPSVSPAVDPAQADVQAFRATAGSFRRGMRTGFNQIGGMLNNLAGSAGLSLGLTEFANDRFQAAKEYSQFAESVAPETRDYGEIKDFNTALDFTLGMAGQGAATSLPALGLALGLRRPVAGVFAGSAPLEAGEQVARIREDPHVQATMTPGQQLAHAATKGAVGGAMEVVGGAPGQVARRILSPARAAGSVIAGTGRAIAGEAATEGAQNLAGQMMHQAISPTQEVDIRDVINDMLAGAAGGGVIGGVGNVAAVTPYAIARTSEELQKRLARPAAPTDPAAEPPGVTSAETTEDIIEELRKNDERLAQEFGTTDLDEQISKFEAGRERHAADYVRPTVNRAIDAIDQAVRRESPTPRRQSLERTPLDDEILDFMIKTMPRNQVETTEPDVLLRLASAVRNLAQTPAASRDPNMVRFLRQALGPDFVPILSFTADKVHTKAGARHAKRVMGAAFRGQTEVDDRRLKRVQNVIRTYGRSQYIADAKRRQVMMDEFAPQLVDFISDDALFGGGLGAAVPGEAEELRAHRAQIVRDMMTRIAEVFGPRADEAFAELENIAGLEPLTSARAFEGPERETATVGLAEEQGEEGVGAEDVEAGETLAARLAPTPMADKRLNKPMSMTDARHTIDALKQTWGVRDVTFRAVPVGDDMFEVRGEPKDVTDLDEAAWDRVRESAPPEDAPAGEKTKYYNKSRPEDGVFTVKAYRFVPSTGKLAAVENKIHAPSGVIEMMRTEKQNTLEGDLAYTADMFARFISALVNAKTQSGEIDADGNPVMVPRFRDFKLPRDAQGNIVFPDNLLVRIIKRGGKNRFIYYGDLKKANFAKGRDIRALRIAHQQAFEQHGPATWAETSAGEITPTNPTAEAVHAINQFFDTERDLNTKVEQMEEEALLALQDTGPEGLFTAIEPMQARVRELIAAERDALEQKLQEAKATKGQRKQVKALSAQIAKVTGGREAELLGFAISRVDRAAERAVMQRPDPEADFTEKEGLAGERREEETLKGQTRGPIRVAEEDVDLPIGEVARRRELERAPVVERPVEAPGPVTVQRSKASYREEYREVKEEHDAETDKAKKAALKKRMDAIAKTGKLAPKELEIDQEPRAPGSARAPAFKPHAPRKREKPLVKPKQKFSQRDVLAEAVPERDRTGEQGELPLERTGAIGLARRGPGLPVAETKTTSQKPENLLRQEAARVAAEKGRKQSLEDMQTLEDIKRGKMSNVRKQRATDFLKRVLGEKIAVEFVDKMDGAGEFKFVDGVEKIFLASNLLNPLHVARHEAIHAFFARLMKSAPQAAQTLSRAANAPHVLARLNELLKDSPNARKQLTAAGQKQLYPGITDAQAEQNAIEERLAYMYQFWAAGKPGLISVGPQTQSWFEKVKAFFRKIMAVWADDLGTAEAMEKAGDILYEFHKGSFANPNTVAEVLHEKFPGDARERLNKIAPFVGKFMDKFVWTSTGAVRNMNLPPLTRIMDQMFTPIDAKDQEIGFRQARYLEFNKYHNRLNAILKGASAARQREIWDDLHSGKEPRMQQAKEISALLNDVFDYMQKAGVQVLARNQETGKWEFKPLKKVVAYFPRMPDVQGLREKPELQEQFLELLRSKKVPNPEGVLSNYMQGPDAGTPRESDLSVGLTFFTPNINERTLTGITDRELAPFLSKNLLETLTVYLSRATRRAEYARRFGNSGENIRAAVLEAKKLGATDAQIKTFDESVQALEGSLGANMSDELKALYGGMMTYQNVRLLPLAIFASLVDPLGIWVRGGTFGEAAGAFWRGMTDLTGAKRDHAFDLGAAVGSINAAVDQALMHDMTNTQYMPKTQQLINDAFFKWNGMESWNRSMRAAAAAAAEQFLIRHKRKPNDHSARYFEELNLKPEDVVVERGKIVLNEKTKQAIARWVDQAILRPDAAIRPVYMSDPHWMLVSHLKQYMYLYQKTIIARAAREFAHGNYVPMAALTSYVPMIIASDMMKIFLTPGQGDDDARKHWDSMDWLGRGIQRAGLLGPSQMALDAYGDMNFGKIGIESAAGPTVQQLLDFLQASAKGTGVGRELLKAIPGERLVRGGF